jgi:hypothetical protein
MIQLPRGFAYDVAPGLKTSIDGHQKLVYRAGCHDDIPSMTTDGQMLYWILSTDPAYHGAHPRPTIRAAAF